MIRSIQIKLKQTQIELKLATYLPEFHPASSSLMDATPALVPSEIELNDNLSNAYRQKYDNFKKN